jgi:phospholipase D-like protein
MIFAGQHTVQFGAAQYTKSYLVPVQPYVNFTQDPIYFSTNVAVVNSFERKFDDAWVDATNFANFGNSATVSRAYPSYTIDASMNFVPAQNFGTRSKARYDAETTRIDVIMYKITEATHADAIIRARQRGVPVRLITEPTRYRNPDNVWQAYFLDRMYAAGVSIRDRAHQGFLHQKTTLLYSQGLAVFGSSNWTTASNGTQYEHNYFTTGSAFFEWFRKVFVRKWNSSTETKAFVPLPPDKPVYVTPANTAGGQPTTVVLSWKPGPWAHRADVYFGTSSTPPLAMKDVTLSPNTTKKLTVSNLEPARSYFWKIVSKTMAGKTAAGPVWSFATQ